MAVGQVHVSGTGAACASLLRQAKGGSPSINDPCQHSLAQCCADKFAVRRGAEFRQMSSRQILSHRKQWDMTRRLTRSQRGDLWQALAASAVRVIGPSRIAWHRSVGRLHDGRLLG